MCQVPRQAEILLKEEHNRLGDGFSPILGSALRPLVLRSVSKKLRSQLFCSSRLSILHSECFYADHPILNWSYNKYWKKYNLCPSNSESSGRHHLLRHSSIKHLLRMWYAPGKGKLSEVKIKTTAFALKEFTQSSHQLSSVQLLSRVSLQPHGLQHSRPPCPSATPGVYSNWCPLSRWCHPTISSSVVPFSSGLQSFPASGSFQMSQLFASGGQNIGVSASTSVLPMNIQRWFLLGWTGWISLQSKGFSSIFSNTTVQKHQFFDAQLFL